MCSRIVSPRLLWRLDSCSVDAELEIDLSVAEAVLVDVAPVKHGCGEPRGVALGQAQLSGARLVDLQPVNAGRRRATVVEVDQFWAEFRVFDERLRQRVGESGDRVLVVTDDPEVYCLTRLWSVFTRRTLIRKPSCWNCSTMRCLTRSRCATGSAKPRVSCSGSVTITVPR